MTRSLLRPLFFFGLVGAAALATASSAFAQEAPAHWNYEQCHNTWDGKLLCLEAQGIFKEDVSASGRLMHLYAERATITVYDQDGSVAYREQRQYHQIGRGPDGEMSAQNEWLHYRYESDGYSCGYSYKLRIVDGEVQLDQQIGECEAAQA